MAKPKNDFAYRDEGTIKLLRPLTENARRWIAEHVNPDESTYFGGSLVVEHRYISDLLAGIQADKLNVIGV